MSLVLRAHEDFFFDDLGEISAALTFYNKNVDKYFKTKTQFVNFFSRYAEEEALVRHPVHKEFLQAVFKKVKERLRKLVEEKIGEINVALNLAKML